MRNSGLKNAQWLSVAIAASLCGALPAVAQLNQNCTVSVLNRTVSVSPDGSWVLPNIPANFGQVKARAICTQNGVTTFGESGFFSLTPNAAVNLPAITLGVVTPIPSALAITPAKPSLSAVGQTVQLAVTATYPDGSTKDVTAAGTGTNYTISNSTIAAISSGGLVTAVSTGNVVVQANNDGATAIISLTVVLGGASHGGIPDQWAIDHGLNPADPVMPFEDPDRDGLTNLQEFQNATDPHNPDTDGDGLNDGDEVNKYKTQPTVADTDGDKIPDGVEIRTGTNPLDRANYNLSKATATSTVTPPSFTLSTSGSTPQVSVQLDWKVKLIDGKTTLDLTNDPRTSFTSSNVNVCNQQQQPGLIFSIGVGSCTITLSQNTLSAMVAGTVTSFTPTELSTLSIPGAIAVDIGGNFAYVATGVNGLAVVDVTDRTNPHVRGTLNNLGDAEGVRVNGQYVYVADATGFLRVVNVQDPDSLAKVFSLVINGNPGALAIHGTLAAVAANTGGVSLVDIKNPVKPTLIGTVATPAAALGVDFDLSSGLLAVAMGSSGLQLIDISNPAKAKLRGLLSGGDVRRVLLRLPAALLADAQRSITSVNLSNPDQPALSSSLPTILGGIPVDIAASLNTAITADSTFGKATPIVNISDPLQPHSVGFWQWQSNPGYGSSIALDLAYAYLVLGSNSVMRILQYQNITDTFGKPPVVAITEPTQGATLIQDQIVTVSVNATDDVAVASVNFLVDGQSEFSTSAAPYQFQYRVSKTATMLIFSATAMDYGNNIGVAKNVTVNVIPDPLTTVKGKVVSPQGNPVPGATVTVLSLSTTSAADGTFSISGLPTIEGDLVGQALAVVNGVTLFAQSDPFAPIVGGITQLGTLKLAPAPVITSVAPRAALAGTTVPGLSITGFNLHASTFALQPAGLTVSNATVNAGGTSANIDVSIPSASSGRYVLVATNPAGSSSTIGSYSANEFVVPVPMAMPIRTEMV